MPLSSRSVLMSLSSPLSSLLSPLRIGRHELAHRVKGGARMVKAHALVACCETLEGVCERRDRGALAAAVEAVGAAIDGLHHSLSQHCKQA